MAQQIFWHSISCEEIFKKLHSDREKGLSEEEVKIRQEKFGKNILPKEKPLSKLKIFLEQFKSPLIYILLIAGLVTLLLRNYIDAIVIFIAVLLNTTVGFLQDNKALKTLRKLKKVIKHSAEVLREGNFKIINSEDVVPGDIIILNPGDRIPADGRIIECQNLEINEMNLTGEWLPAKKSLKILPKGTPLADRNNMVYMGTFVEKGRGKAIVVATGLHTEIGRIAQMLKETKEEQTPYQKKLSHLSRVIGIIIGVIGIGIFFGGVATGKDFIEMFNTAIAIAISAIPEGLPVAITVILALGMQKILEKKGLVKRLVSAEALGNVSIIATDKTGTLTKGKMKATEIIGDKYLVLKIAVLTSEAFVENPQDPKEKWVLRGRPTEKAFLEAAVEIGISKKKEFEKQKIAEIPFNPVNKFSVAVYQEGEKKVLYICGAPDKILERCYLKDSEKEEWKNKLNKLTQKGLRVIGTAYRYVDFYKEKDSLQIEKLCHNLTFAGIIALQDPIREEVKEAIRFCRQAGIRVIIVTGDHKLTAKRVAEELGFQIRNENILEGKDLDKLSDEDLGKILDKIKIYARVEPRHKMRIIKAWQEKGEVIAMTGDGVNDAPALKKADIGVALGSGTELAKETSDLILLDDSFSIITSAIEEGRAIIDNIRKVVTFLLSDSFTEVILIGGSIILGWPLPVLPVQILWANLIGDGILSLPLAFEPKEKNLMSHPPQKHNAPLLTKEMKSIILIVGFITNLLLFGLLFWLIKYSGYEISHIRSVIFVALVIDSFFYVFSCKNLRKNIWNINIFSNKLLIFAWICGMGALISILYIPFLQVLFKTVPLNIFDWQLIFGIGLIDLLLIEVAKHYFIVRHQTER